MGQPPDHQERTGNPHAERASMASPNTEQSEEKQPMALPLYPTDGETEAAGGLGFFFIDSLHTYGLRLLTVLNTRDPTIDI